MALSCCMAFNILNHIILYYSELFYIILLLAILPHTFAVGEMG